MPPGRTLRQHLHSLAQQDSCPQFADDLLRYHYATTYGDRTPDKNKEKQLSSLITNW
jgi:hypothetical protein